jgi:hypothetical protein
MVRQINFSNTVLKEALGYSNVWLRPEFAEFRGQIHTHAIYWGKHADIVKNILQNSQTEIDKATKMEHFLQGSSYDDPEQNLFSP